MTHVHFIGIGGTGLSAIARVLLEKGYKISGSDRQLSPLAQSLQSDGIQVFIGHHTDNIKGADLVIRSSAVSDDNPEVIAARMAGIPVLKRADFLSHLLNEYQVISVSGTHGKTTTTAMIAWMLTALMQDPSYIIGGVSSNLGKNAQAGKGPFFVIEADEYDRMFLGIHPHLAIITNIEHDHPDCFPTSEDFYQAFQAFSRGIPKNGVLIICNDDIGAVRLAHGTVEAGRKVITYSLSNNDCDYQAKNISIDTLKGGFSFDACRKGEFIAHICLQVPGIHNVSNALGALAAIDQLPLAMSTSEKIAIATEALDSFTGTGRRFEVRGVVNQITIVDDYAHHPTEIKATLSAARSRYPGQNIWAIWQPHTYSRIQALSSLFASAFDEANHVIVTDIYAAREARQDQVSISDIVKAMAHTDALFIPEFCDIVSYLEPHLRPNDVVLVLSAGDADQISTQLLEGRLSKETRGTNRHLSIPPQLKTIFGNRLKFNLPLAPYTSAHIGGPADGLLLIESADELALAVAILWKNDCPFVLLGSGSNILISDAGVRGLVLINRARQIKFDDVNANVWAESGANFSLLARQTAGRGLSGLEWAAGIPGTLGGAIVGNAGAHGGETSHQLIMAEILQHDEIRQLAYDENNISTSTMADLRKQWNVEQLKYEYRTSILKRNPGEAIVLSARLQLQAQPSELIQAKMGQYLKHRRCLQPSGPSMGSLFKNPPGNHAGKLIEAAGLKGKRIGDVEISSKHANFFINLGQGNARDMWKLIQLARQSVAEKYDINMELEIERIGDWDI